VARTGRPSGDAFATLFGLAPCGVLPATDVTAGAVRSYRTFSPLPAFALRAPLDKPLARPASPTRRRSEDWRYIFCATFRQVSLPGRYPAHCPVEFGLSSRRTPERREAGDRLADCDLLIM